MKTTTKPAKKTTSKTPPLQPKPLGGRSTAKPPAKARRLEEIAESKKGLFAIDPTLLSIEPGFNKRQNFGDLRQLAEDIAANGLDQPLKIRKIEGTETIHIVSGHRRHRAITEILIPEGRWHGTVDCYSEPKHTSRIDRLVSQICGNTGLPYTLLEKAAVYQEILTEDPAIKPADLSRRFGESKQAVSDALRLVKDGCPLLIENVRHETLAASTAIQIVKTAKDPAEQESLLQDALATAHAAGRSHVMPKDLPANSTPPTDQPDPSDPSDQSDPPAAPTKTPAPSKQETLKPSAFTLYLIDGAPEEPIADDSPFYHETDRLALEVPDNFEIERLHLLCAATPHGVAYGYRFNDYERLPDIGDIETLDASPEEGFKAMLAACAKLAPNPQDFYKDTLDDLLFDALCRYYPESGMPEEPKHLAFVAAPQAAAPTGSANPGFQQTLNTSSGGGGNGGGGGSTYLDPQTLKAVSKIEEILDDLEEEGKGHIERIKTTEIVLGVLRNERPASELKAHLLGK